MKSDKNRNASDVKRDLFKFGLTLSIAFSLLGALCFWTGRAFYYYFLILSAVFLFTTLMVPGLLKPVRRGWKALGGMLGWLTTRAVLALVFYVAVTPIGVVGRLLGRRFLAVELHSSSESYWIRRGQTDAGPERYERQY